MRYEKTGSWGISKGGGAGADGGESPARACQRGSGGGPNQYRLPEFHQENGIKLLPGGSWAFHGEEFPYTSFGLERFPFCHVLKKSFAARELTMYDLYLLAVQNPNHAAVIQAEKITGPVLLNSSKMDTMWTSELAAKYLTPKLL